MINVMYFEVFPFGGAYVGNTVRRHTLEKCKSYCIKLVFVLATVFLKSSVLVWAKVRVWAKVKDKVA